MTPENPITSHGEHAVVPERPRYELVWAIALAGPAGTGKDALAAELKRRHGWEVEDGSSYGFERRGTSSHQGYINRQSRDHLRFDTEQAKYFRELAPNSPKKILQTRLSHIILAEERDRRAKDIIENQRLRQTREDVPELGPIPAISVALEARRATRIDRAFKAAHEAWEDQQARLAAGQSLREGEKLIRREPTQHSVMQAMDHKERTTTDKNWAPIHPQYIRVGGNPFSHALKRPNGGRVIDLVIETDKKVGNKIENRTIEEIADEFEARLLKRGAIRPVDPESPANQGPETGDLISRGVVFDLDPVEQVRGEPFSPRPAMN